MKLIYYVLLVLALSYVLETGYRCFRRSCHIPLAKLIWYALCLFITYLIGASHTLDEYDIPCLLGIIVFIHITCTLSEGGIKDLWGESRKRAGKGFCSFDKLSSDSKKEVK